jgi:GT2 family glycosyltransferase
MEADPQVAIAAPMLVFHDRPDIIQAAGIALTKTGRVGYLNRGKPVAAVSPIPVDVAAVPTACWLVRREAQQAIGLFSEEYYPVQYEDIDLCVRLKLAGWKILCDRSIRIKHIENVTTRNLKDHPFARLTVRRGMFFKKKWADVLPKIATITEDEIYWGPIPRRES